MSTSTTVVTSQESKAILDAALKLSFDERVELAERLLESLGPPTQPDVEFSTEGIRLKPEFQAELDRRIAEVENGTAVFYTAEEVFREVRAELAERRST